MKFADLEKTNVVGKVEKKGRFSYLSWPFAVSEFRKACPNGRWEINRFGELPYQKTDNGAFVSVTVWPDVIEEAIFFEQVHPVLNNQNKPIVDPNPFDVNTSIQRCLVKAIAIATGIGLYIYAGEDLPPGEEEPQQFITDENVKTIKDLLSETGADESAFLKFAKAESIETIPAGSLKKIMAMLEKKKIQMRQPGED